MTIQDVINQEDGSWVNGPITATFTSTKNLETKTGKTMSVGKVGDGTGTMDVTSFAKDLHRLEGKTVELSGPGMKKETYNGYPKLALGDKTKITPMDAPANVEAVDGQVIKVTPVAAASPEKVKEVLEGMVDKYVLCATAAMEVVANTHDAGFTIDVNAAKDIATTFFIGLNQKGL